jgi:hypothetical protein
MKASYCRISQGILLCLALLSAARGADAPPSVDSILDKFVEACGGRMAMEKIKSRTIRGDLDLMGSTSDWVLEAKAPNKQFSGFNNATLGDVADGFDGTVAWSKNQSGVRVKEGEELAKTKRDAEFHRNLTLKKLYPDLAYKGTEKVDGEEVHVLESKPSASTMERFSFSTKSNLLIRQESEFEGPQGKIGVTVRLTDFRPVDGIKYAHNMKFKLRAGEQEFEFGIKVKEVKHDRPMEDAKFSKPSL